MKTPSRTIVVVTRPRYQLPPNNKDTCGRLEKLKWRQNKQEASIRPSPGLLVVEPQAWMTLITVKVIVVFDSIPTLFEWILLRLGLLQLLDLELAFCLAAVALTVRDAI